jgi:hypothetical protein
MLRGGEVNVNELFWAWKIPPKIPTGVWKASKQATASKKRLQSNQIK